MFKASSLSAEEIVGLSKKHTLFEWSAQASFAPIPMVRAKGVHFWDANGNGLNDDTNGGIREATVTLTGTTDAGQPVELTVITADDGSYTFTGLEPGTYAITETQPFGYFSGTNTVGTVDGMQNGTYDDVLGDRFYNIDLDAGKSGVNYNFGELLDGAPS